MFWKCFILYIYRMNRIENLQKFSTEYQEPQIQAPCHPHRCGVSTILTASCFPRFRIARSVPDLGFVQRLAGGGSLECSPNPGYDPTNKSPASAASLLFSAPRLRHTEPSRLGS